MKRWITLALTLALILSLAGCGMSRKVTPEEVNDIDYGTLENGTYENSHFGIGYRFEEEWNTDTQQQIWARNEWDANKDIREQMLKSLKKPNYFWEMHTESQAKDITVDVSIDNVSVLADPDLSQEEYAKYSAEQTMDHFNQVKVANVEAELIEQTVAGKTWNGVRIWFEAEGEPYYYTILYLKKGIYAVELKVSCTGEDVTEEILENFYEIKNQPSKGG